MRGPRVLHILQNLSGYGAERQVRDLLPYLQSDGITAAALTVYASKLSDEELRALPFLTIDIGRRSRLDYNFLPQLIKAIRSFRPDIVHTHTHVGKYWGRIAARIAGVRVLLHTEHNPCDPRRNILERLLDPALHAATSCVVTFLAQQRTMLSRTDHLPVEKIRIIANGLLPRELPEYEDRAAARKALGITPDEYAVVVIGRLEHQKNQQLALRAVASLTAPVQQRVRLYLLGAGSQEDELRSLSRELGIEHNVLFFGYRNDVGTLLPGADVLLMTSLFEGMPLTLIEAMFAGVPIVSTPWIGVDDMLENGRYGFIAAGWETGQVALTLERALRCESARATAAARAYAYARTEYDIRNTARAHLQLYSEMIARTP